MYRIGFDVGGTFTDFTLHDTATGMLRHFKVPSTPADPSEAIETGLRTLLDTLHIAPDAIGFIGHGTTVATNMVIERRGVITGLITTRGFRDVLEIGRQVRPHLYDYTVRTPTPLVPRERRLEVAERIDAAGSVLHALDEAEVAAAAAELAGQGVQAIAICFLHSYLNDTHERRAAGIVRAGACRMSMYRRHPACCRNSASSNDSPRPRSTPISARGWNAISTASSVGCPGSA